MDISAVIVSYNSSRFLVQNLDSLLRQSVPFKHIIVVDNHSGDDSLNVLAPFQDRVEILALTYNSGYAAAANMGIRGIRNIRNLDSQLILVANADIILEENFNALVLEKMQTEQDIALLSPLILRFDKKTVDSAGQACSKALHPREIGYNRPLSEIPLREQEVFSVCGAATVFRRDALELLEIDNEYYDEDFFIFWEDFDIGWRARLLGLKTLFFPKAVVYHFRSATLKRNLFSRFSLALARPAHIKYHLVKNRFLTLIKNFRCKPNLKALPVVILKDIIWVGLLTFVSPKIIIPLMKSGKYIIRALEKRRQINERIRLLKSHLPRTPGTHHE